jgi:hypothetical protein
MKERNARRYTISEYLSSCLPRIDPRRRRVEIVSPVKLTSRTIRQQSPAITSGHQRPSAAISGRQCPPAIANARQSPPGLANGSQCPPASARARPYLLKLINTRQSPSAPTSVRQLPVSAHQRPSEPVRARHGGGADTRSRRTRRSTITPRAQVHYYDERVGAQPRRTRKPTTTTSAQMHDHDGGTSSSR